MDTPVRVTQSAEVGRVYDRMASVYDVAFGPLLQAGRRRALACMAPVPGMRILEIGVGTGLSLPLYPPDCLVSGIDISPGMLLRAEERVVRRGLSARLFQMDATDLRFPDDAFDVVFAPYVMSVVPDPVAVLREMYRVCAPGGRLFVLNHFRSRDPFWSRVERRLSPLTRRVGFTADLDREGLFAAAGLEVSSEEFVNRPRIWSLVTVSKPGDPVGGTGRAARLE